jgi:hypothetical protein
MPRRGQWAPAETLAPAESRIPAEPRLCAFCSAPHQGKFVKSGAVCDAILKTAHQVPRHTALSDRDTNFH